ncbi:MAG: spore maturation protein [Clostridia bacterium]|nr:spore maturation protein [Clostridia bacterium]
MGNIASFALPIVFTLLGLIMAFSKKDTVSMFLGGCREGIKTSFGLLPTLIMLIVAVRMFSASGALDALCNASLPLCKLLGIPQEMLPVAIMRPVSGSGAIATIKQLFDTSGPDSSAGRTASVLMGSSDTILYTLSVYFSHVGAKKTGYAFPASFTVMIFCIAASCVITRYAFMP